MATQASTITVKLAGTLQGSTDLSSLVDTLLRDYSQNLSNGTGANQANIWWHDQRTLSASATENLDLAGSLVDVFGATKTFTRIKAILVKASSGNTNAVQVQRASSNGVPLFMAASDGVALTPGALMLLVFPDATGIAVTAGTGDILTITNSAGSTSVTYDIVIIGTE